MKDLSKRFLGDESAAIRLGEIAKQKQALGERVVSFALGEPLEPTPMQAIKAGVQALEQGKTKYTPTQGVQPLRQKICDWTKICTGVVYEPHQIVVGNGAKHSIFNAVLAVVSEGEEVIIPAPYWVSYPNIVLAAGAEPVFVDTSKTGFKMTAESLHKEITKRTKMVVINTPNNPSGVVYTQKELQELAEIIIEHDLYVLADEIYGGFVYEGKYTSVASIEGLKDRTILIGGMSKDFAMTGLRIGWSASNPQIATACTVMQSHTASCPCSVSQEAAFGTLSDTKQASAFVENTRLQYDERRLLLMESLDKLGMEYVIPKGAFYILVSIKQFVGQKAFGVEIDSADTFANLLLEKAGVVVVPCEPFGIDNYIRLSCTIGKKDIIEGVKQLEKFLSELETVV